MKIKLLFAMIAIVSSILAPFSVKGSSPLKKVLTTTTRSKVNESTTVQFSMTRDPLTSTTTITAIYVSSISTDAYSSYLLDGAYLGSGNSILLPSGGVNFWKINFDFNNSHPPVVQYAPTGGGGGAVPFDCLCITNMQEGCNGGCSISSVDGGCINCCNDGCQCNCMPSQISMFLSASVVVYNSTTYTAY